MAKRSAGLSSARQQAQEPEPYTFPDDEPVVTPENAVETARYISEMTMELARMASSAGLETTCYLLTMARVEAEAAPTSSPRGAFDAGAAPRPPPGT